MVGWVGELRATIVPTLAQPTGFSHRSECDNKYLTKKKDDGLTPVLKVDIPAVSKDANYQ